MRLSKKTSAREINSAVSEGTVVPVSRIFQEKRVFVTFVSIVLFIDLVVYAFAVFPWINKVVQAERRSISAEDQLVRVKTQYAEVKETRENKNNLDAELQRFYADVLPLDLAEARSISSSLLVRLAEESNLVLERRNSVPVRERDSLLARLRTTMVLTGGYENILEFIYELETAEEFIVIEEIGLNQRGSSGGELVLTLGVSIYYLERTDASL